MLRLVTTSLRGYAKKAAGGSAPSMPSQKVKLPVVTDPVKLATYCCGSNIKQTGEDVKLGPDEDYPDWLWDLNVGKPLEVHEMSPDTEEYWEKLEKDCRFRTNRLKSALLKPEIRINEKKKLAITESVVHRALAYKYYDPGHDMDRSKKELYRKYGPLHSN